MDFRSKKLYGWGLGLKRKDMLRGIAIVEATPGRVLGLKRKDVLRGTDVFKQRWKGPWTEEERSATYIALLICLNNSGRGLGPKRKEALRTRPWTEKERCVKRN